MKKISFSIMFLLLAFFVNAQKGFERGYVITNKGDTLKGQIKDRKEPKSAASWQKIRFINEKTGESEKLTADELKGYVKRDSVVFKTLALGIESRNQFVEIIENGPIIMYARVWAEETGDGAAAVGMIIMGPAIYGLYKLTRKKGEFYLQAQNDPRTLMEWRERDYKMTAKYFFRENKELVKQIEDEKYKYGDLQTIVRSYNEWKIKQ
ncbi:MAG: hypothetical protein ACXVC6_09825 [Bacteroidia bacterium]